MRWRSFVLLVIIPLSSLYLFGQGIEVNISDLKINNVTVNGSLNGADEIRLFSDFNGKHYLLGYYSNNRIKIVPISDSLYLALTLKRKNMKPELTRESRVPFIVYEFFSSEMYSVLLLSTYSQYGINNASLDVATFPVMTAAGIIIPLIYTSNNEISYGECIHSFTSNIYLGGIGLATNYLFSDQFEPLSTFISALTGNIAGYWMAKKKRYTPGQALIYDEILQKTSYISISASTVYQDSTVNGKIVASSFLGATIVGAISSYILADKFKDMSSGDIFLYDGLSNSIAASAVCIAASFTDNGKIIIPISYAMFIPGYYVGYSTLKSGHLSTADGVVFNLGVYAGFLLGGAVDALLSINTSYNEFIGTAVGGLTATFLMYKWVKGRTTVATMDSKIGIEFNPVPMVSHDALNNFTYSLNRLITIKF